MTSCCRTPLVSVAICTYNRASLLTEAVRSVLDQSLRDFELLICDDASSDETPRLCEEWAADDPRIRVLRHPANLGMIGNWNSGLYASRGRYFAKLDDDNRYLPAFLETTVQALRENPEASFAFCDEWFIDAEGRRQEELTGFSSRKYGRAGLEAGLHRDTPLLAARQSMGINASVFVREALVEAGGFRAFGGNIADLDVFLNLAARGRLACYVPERLAEYRDHPGMGTTDLLVNAVKARAAVAMWDACRFEGEAESIRRLRLAGAYSSLSRVSAIGGDLPAARQSIRRAMRLRPFSPRLLGTGAVLHLPAPLLSRLLLARYGDRLQAIHGPAEGKRRGTP